MVFCTNRIGEQKFLFDILPRPKERGFLLRDGNALPRWLPNLFSKMPTFRIPVMDGKLPEILCAQLQVPNGVKKSKPYSHNEGMIHDRWRRRYPSPP